ncbi:PadR family transcriptional regulator [Cellulomonas composti]|uniref:Transcriptional regulator n=1 Tax=Cellulomonas composti TaxID=266130 RepID=A0A511J9J6_9CELL|nr:PadR family transcriptional regulator [Cellulomonas composti]GEL94665.1 transcriptional regulator [Cellulomonas composti]
MSVRQGLLALLAETPMHAYQMRQQFEHRTGGTWPLNMGQVSTTLDRLVRDGLVEPADTADADAEVQRYHLTAAGRDELATWWATPVVRSTPARDELSIKLALAVSAPGVDVRTIVQAQRTETMRAMTDLTRLKADLPASGWSSEDLAWSLVLDHLVFAAEAEVRWLDHVESRVARAAAEGGTSDETAVSRRAAATARATAATAAASGGAR